MSNYKIGDTVIVKVGHTKYKTVIDSQGVQRFEANSVIDYLFETNQIDLNRLSIDYQKGKFTKKDYAEFCMMLGYSVCGFADLSSFDGYTIKNPVWEEEEENDTHKSITPAK